jgi:hypothetical protein
MVPPPTQNTVGVRDQSTFLILYYRLVLLLQVTCSYVNLWLFYFTVSFKSIYFSYHIFILFVPEMYISLGITLFTVPTLLWFGSYNHCSLSGFLWSKKPKLSLSNYGICCFNLYRPRFSSVEVFIFSLTFAQALFMSSLSLMFSKAANLFQILFW